MRALIAKDGVGAGHFQRSCIVGAERDRRSRPTLVIPAALASAATLSKPTSWPILTVALFNDSASA